MIQKPCQTLGAQEMDYPRFSCEVGLKRLDPLCFCQGLLRARYSLEGVFLHADHGKPFFFNGSLLGNN